MTELALSLKCIEEIEKRGGGEIKEEERGRWVKQQS